MQLDRRTFMAGAAARRRGRSRRPRALAQEKVVQFGMPQDFTRVYTFVTAEYSQGQRDYFTLVNERGGVNGYKIVADVSDHGNDLPRAIEAYERDKREGAVLIDPLSTPVARALVPRALRGQDQHGHGALGPQRRGRRRACSPTCCRCRRTTGPRPALLIDYFRQQDKGT